MLAPLTFLAGIGGLTYYGRKAHEDDGTAGFPHGYFGQQGRLGPKLDLGLNKIHHPGADRGAPTINYAAGLELPNWAARNYRQHRINHTSRSTHWSSDQSVVADYSKRPLSVTSARFQGVGSTSSQFVMDERNKHDDVAAYYGGTVNTPYWDPRNHRGKKYRHDVRLHEF